MLSPVVCIVKRLCINYSKNSYVPTTPLHYRRPGELTSALAQCTGSAIAAALALIGPAQVWTGHDPAAGRGASRCPSEHGSPLVTHLSRGGAHRPVDLQRGRRSSRPKESASR